MEAKEVSQDTLKKVISKVFKDIDTGAYDNALLDDPSVALTNLFIMNLIEETGLDLTKEDAMELTLAFAKLIDLPEELKTIKEELSNAEN